MSEDIIKALVAVMNDNIGNKITPALGTGIVNLMSQVIIKLEEDRQKSVVAPDV